MQVLHYFDYKSPYAYLAQEATDRLETATGVPVHRLPYTLDIPAFLGAARLDETGKDVLGTRSDHQWRRVRYSYMDCRREANRRGLIIRGPRKIWDSSLAHLGYLYALHAIGGHPRRYHDAVFARFWRRELDLEDRQVIADALETSGVDIGGFPSYLAGPGRRELEALHQAAEAAGVFGVPSWLVDGELFWGSERLGRVREAIAASGHS